MLFRNSIIKIHCKISPFRKAIARISTSIGVVKSSKECATDIHLSSLESILKQVTIAHPRNNIPESIIPKIGRKLHLQKDHPLNVVKKRIEDYCQGYAERKYGKLPNNELRRFAIYDSLSPVVDTKSCFDDLLVQADHVSRRPSDTYYINDNLLLRTHTSAHQCQLISSGSHMFLCSGDVFRRDEIDASHYPVFHQMEGVKVFDPTEFPPGDSRTKEIIEADLKELLTGLALHLFGNVEMRWNSDYFPFTNPSFELEVNFNGEWLEVLGCGVIHDKVMENAGKSGMQGWAFGLGLERLAMVLFKIPDIRLFWTSDERFHTQFTGLSESPHKSVSFVSYSKYPSCYKDVSFWLPQNPGEAGSSLHMNDIFEVIRNVAGDLVERVDLFDEFTHKKTGRISHAYRITYRHMDRSLTNSEVDDVQFKLRERLVTSLKVELR
jgi:phenylalanyl-tRNA synthetase alpha chain